MVPFCSATISPACFSTLKWPDSVERASGKALGQFAGRHVALRSSRRISRRVGSLKA